MNAGALRKKLSFQRRSGAPNSFGELANYAGYYKCFGSVAPLRGQLYYSTGDFISKSTYSIGIRYPKNITITVADHIVVDGLTFEVQSIIDKDLRHRELQILCYVVNEVSQ